MKNKAVIFMMSMVLAMGSAVPAHADTEISENKDLAEKLLERKKWGMVLL